MWLFPISVACLANPATAQTQVLANIGLSKGWATFGQALPQGAVRGTVLVGNSPTQTDVKTRWPDGSIRFAVLTAKVTATGTFSLVAAKANSGSFVSTVPTAQVRFVIAGTTWTASLPATPSTDVWLSGPLVKEWRSVVSPTNPDEMSHPFLRVIFDCRSYLDGKSPSRRDGRKRSRCERRH